jgi:hypothetical protein
LFVERKGGVGYQWQKRNKFSVSSVLEMAE